VRVYAFIKVVVDIKGSQYVSMHFKFFDNIRKKEMQFLATLEGVWRVPFPTNSIDHGMQGFSTFFFGVPLSVLFDLVFHVVSSKFIKQPEYTFSTLGKKIPRGPC
jgi:hypothetical protein